MSLFLFQASNPVETVSKFGPYLGSVFICTALFIWCQIQMYKLGKTLEQHTQKINEQTEAQLKSNQELKEIVITLGRAQTEQAESIHKLAEAIHHQTERQGEMHSEQLGLIRDMVTEQKLLSQSQTTITQGFQRVVESLIDAMKES